MITVYDKTKLAELVDDVSKLSKERVELAMSMTDNWSKREKDKWTDHQYLDHRANTERHTVLAQQIGLYEQDIAQMTALSPKEKLSESQRLVDPMVRWGEVIMAKVGNIDVHFNAEEQKQYLTNPADIGAAAFGMEPDKLGIGFKIPFPEDAVHSSPLMVTRSDAASGQELVPETRLPRIIQRLKAFGGATTFSDVFTTPTGADYVIPNLDDTTNLGEGLAAQNSPVGSQDLEDVGSSTFKAYTWTSKGIKVSWESEMDSIPNLMNVVQDIAGRRIGRIRNAALTNGSGTNQPLGLVNSAKEAATTAESHKIGVADIETLIYAVDDGYLEGEGDPLGFDPERAAGMVGFMIHRGVEQGLVALKDSQNRPLWLPSIQSRLGGVIYGYPYVKNYSMPALTLDNGYSMLFGNGNYYGTRQVRDIQFFRFFDSATVLGASGKLTVQFVALARGDGQPRGGFSSTNTTEAYQKLKTKA